MLSYEVTIQLEDPALAGSLERYMREKHLSEVFETGCFLDAHFERAAPDVYRTRYAVLSQENLDRYSSEYAAQLREDFKLHFPAGLRVSRTVWSECAALGPALQA